MGVFGQATSGRTEGFGSNFTLSVMLTWSIPRRMVIHNSPNLMKFVNLLHEDGEIF